MSVGVRSLKCLWVWFPRCKFLEVFVGVCPTVWNLSSISGCMSQNEVSLLCPCICLSVWGLSWRVYVKDMGVCQTPWYFSVCIPWGMRSLICGVLFWGGCIMWVFKYVCDCMTYDVGPWSLWTCVSYGIKCLSSLLVYIPSVRSLICWVVYFQECKVSDLFVAIYSMWVCFPWCMSRLVCVYISWVMRSLICFWVYVTELEVPDLFVHRSLCM